jgi:hypothetical protein
MAWERQSPWPAAFCTLARRIALHSNARARVIPLPSDSQHAISE